jgi:uncharacterized membrane protein YphA (DoxX/SURF4 family)
VLGATMAATTALGRALFSFIFFASGLEKWRALRAHGADAALFHAVTPALRSLKSSINANVGVNLCALLPSDHALVRAATALELAGAALFACGFALGAKMLILFTLSVTFAMHPFWRSASEAAVLGDEATAGIEMIMFFKNIALVGALVFWLGMRSEMSELREASKETRKRA